MFLFFVSSFVCSLSFAACFSVFFCSVITITVSATYSSITSATLKELWNLSDRRAFEEAVAAQGWTFTEEGKTVVIRAAAAAAEEQKNNNAAASAAAQCPSIEQMAKLITAA